jgi:hypothetical protein
MRLPANLTWFCYALCCWEDTTLIPSASSSTSFAELQIYGAQEGIDKRWRHMILNGGPTWDFILVAIYSSLWIIKQKLRR